MARAGQGAWRHLLAHWPQAQRIGVLCGPGNNGGDGYVVAGLARQSGRQVALLTLGPAREGGPAARAAQACMQAGVTPTPYRSGEALPEVDLWVDALFGIGCTRALTDDAARLVDAVNASGVPVFALDVPSGADADTGDCPGPVIHATRTLSFIAAKPGLFTGRGRVQAGEVAIDPLDLPDDVFADLAPVARVVCGDALGAWLRPRARDAHKGRFGHVLCIGGDEGAGGAIALCAEAAHRVGAGLVSAATRLEHVAVLLSRRPETMVHAIGATDGVTDAHASRIAPLIERASVIALGPGLGTAAWGASLLAAVLRDRHTGSQGRPCVFDADALNLLARHDVVALGDAVLTPHPGEAARLLGTTVAEIERDRLSAARQLSARFDCVVVLKGAGTLVAAPGETPMLMDAGNPGMAAGGMGDVLTGTIAGLLAQFAGAAPDGRRVACFEAAVCGALLHAVAGDVAAREGGERGLLPSDLFAPLRRLANP